MAFSSNQRCCYSIILILIILLVGLHIATVVQGYLAAKEIDEGYNDFQHYLTNGGTPGLNFEQCYGKGYNTFTQAPANWAPWLYTPPVLAATPAAAAVVVPTTTTTITTVALPTDAIVTAPFTTYISIRLTNGNTNTFFPANTIVPAGTYLPSGTTVPSGTQVVGATTLTTAAPQNSQVTLAGNTFFPSGALLPAGFTFPAGTVIPAGTTLPAGSVGSVVNQIAGQPPVQINLATATTTEFAYTLAAPFTLPAATTFANGINLLSGTTIPAGTPIPAGTQISLGNVINTGVASSTTTTVPVATTTTTTPAGTTTTTFPAGTTTANTIAAATVPVLAGGQPIPGGTFQPNPFNAKNYYNTQYYNGNGANGYYNNPIMRQPEAHLLYKEARQELAFVVVAAGLTFFIAIALLIAICTNCLSPRVQHILAIILLVLEFAIAVVIALRASNLSNRREAYPYLEDCNNHFKNWYRLSIADAVITFALSFVLLSLLAWGTLGHIGGQNVITSVVPQTAPYSERYLVQTPNEVPARSYIQSSHIAPNYVQTTPVVQTRNYVQNVPVDTHKVVTTTYQNPVEVPNRNYVQTVHTVTDPYSNNFVRTGGV